MTLFEKIIAGDIPGDFVHQDEHCVVLRDIAPQAPTHLLIIPRKRIPRLARAEDADQALLGHLLLVARNLAAELGFQDEAQGFRIVINNGTDGGEAVPHLHIHLLAGRKLAWPPG